MNVTVVENAQIEIYPAFGDNRNLSVRAVAPYFLGQKRALFGSHYFSLYPKDESVSFLQSLITAVNTTANFIWVDGVITEPENCRIFIQTHVVYGLENPESFEKVVYTSLSHGVITLDENNPIEHIVQIPPTASEVQANYVNSFVSDANKRLETENLYFQHLSLLNGGG